MGEAAVVVGKESPAAELSPEGGDARREGELQQPVSGEGAQARRLQLGKKKPQEAPAAPKGRPKSGRVWKDRNKKRFSHMTRDKPLRTTWECKMKERQAKKLVKEFAQHLKDEKQRAREEKKQRREDNLKRRLENERKAEIVQVIRNPLKLKRAKKKQLRRIEKRDTLALLQKHQAQRKAPKD